MVTATLEGDRIVVAAEYYDKDTVRALPGSSFAGGRWTVPAGWSSYLALTGTFGDRLQTDVNFQRWAYDLYAYEVYPSLVWRDQLDAPGDPALFPFQRGGSAWLRLERPEHLRPIVGMSCGKLLADEMGTGKTIQTIDAWKGLPDPFPVLIIAPRNVKRKWQREIEKWWPGLVCSIVGGSAKQRRDALTEPAHVYIIHWEAVRLHSRLAPYGNHRLKRCRACGGLDSVTESTCEVHLKELNTMGFKTVVADEAHKLFEPSTKWTRAVWAVGHGSTVTYRIALTGTPVGNAPDDTWGILHFIDPVQWPTRSKYIDRYCLKSWNTWGGMEVVGVRPDTMTEFYGQLDPVMRRMPKELVLPFLPPKLREVRDAEMSTKQARAYREMKDGLITELEDGSVVFAKNQLVSNTRLMQFSSAYATVNDAGEVRLSEPSSKLDVLEDVLEELGWRWATKTGPSRAGESLVVFAESRQLIELAAARLEKHGVRHHLLTGGLTDDQLDAITVSFNDGPPSVALVVIKAGKEGMDLMRARHAVFLQRSWSMLDNKQAEDRVHRIGSEQHDKIELIDVIAPGTIEEKQVDKLHAKLGRLEEITRDKARLHAAGLSEQARELEQEETNILRSDLL